MLIDEKFFVAGHTGLVGSAICRRLEEIGVGDIVTRTHKQLDLTDQQAVADFFKKESVDRVILAAAMVGGIHANNAYPAEFIYKNLMIEANVIHQAFKAGIQRLLFLGSSCIYPKHAPQPLKEDYLLTGSLEPTNAPYAVAKIAGIQLCEAYNRQYGTTYRAVMPTNLYGPNDNFDLENAHVLPAMIRKFHLSKMMQTGDMEAVRADERRFGDLPDAVKSSLGISFQGNRKVDPAVVLWGTGSPCREFMFVDDLADACVYVLSMADEAFAVCTAPYGFPFINVGCGKDLSIRELASLVAGVVGFEGKVLWDRSRADGTPKKLMDVSRLNRIGWTAGTELAAGIRKTYEWYLKELNG